MFSQVVVRHGVATHSDHLRVMFETKLSRVRERKKKQFKFEAIWVEEEKCAQVI